MSFCKYCWHCENMFCFVCQLLNFRTSKTSGLSAAILNDQYRRFFWKYFFKIRQSRKEKEQIETLKKADVKNHVENVHYCPSVWSVEIISIMKWHDPTSSIWQQWRHIHIHFQSITLTNSKLILLIKKLRARISSNPRNTLVFQ